MLKKLIELILSSSKGLVALNCSAAVLNWNEDELACFVLASPFSDFITRIWSELRLIKKVVLGVLHAWIEELLLLISVDTL